MQKVSVYREHAQECRQLAQRMTVPEQRQQLEEMAKTWDMLAEKRKRHLSSPPKKQK